MKAKNHYTSPDIWALPNALSEDLLLQESGRDENQIAEMEYEDINWN